MSLSRNTIQRQLVLEAVSSTHLHPTADEVYGMIAKTHPSVSRATVYRNLNLLASQGDIRRLPQPGLADRYDYNMHPHAHFYCDMCKRVYDVPAPQLPASALVLPEGFVSERQEHSYYGICPYCRQKEDAGTI